MDLRLWLLLQLALLSVAWANSVFKVESKFKGRDLSLRDLRAHDVRRHARFLSALDLPLGGNGLPSQSGLYFAKIGLGSPPKDYYVQVDTGSDILWVNCVDCSSCPKKSDLGVELKLFDPKSSTTSKLVTCNQDFCTSTYNGPIPGCKSDMLCQYNVVYGDGSTTSGYFVNDTVHLEQMSGNRQTSSMNGTVIFGCGAKQSGELGSSSEALDGIIGFGQANSSMISQLAAAGKVKKMFAHCLDNKEGGGIFAIGQVVEPKVTTTSIIPNQAHYNIAMKDIEVDGEVLQIPSDIFDLGNSKGAIIDSGTTLAYLPDNVFDPLMAKLLAKQSGLKLQTVEESFTCFTFSGRALGDFSWDNSFYPCVNDGFPTVKFHFDDSLTLTVYPNDYLFQIRDDTWCFGWQNSGMSSKDGKDMTLLGDLVLSNKLVVYDLENQVIGWTNYNCSSSIKVKDDGGTVHSVEAENLSSAAPSSRTSGNGIILLLILIAMYNNLYY